MGHFGVDISSMDIVNMAPPDGAAAFAQGELDMVCGWGGSLRRMKEHGNVLLTGAEKEELGILVFDVTSPLQTSWLKKATCWPSSWPLLPRPTSLGTPALARLKCCL